MNKYLPIFLATFITVTAFAQEAKIGVITDLSGYGAFWGQQTRLGVKLLEEDLQQAGLKVTFVFGDSAFKPAQAVSEAQKLIAADQVDALFAEFSSVVNAVSGVAKKSQRLLLATCGARSFLDTNPYALKTFLNYTEGCRQIVSYWKKQGLVNFGIMRVTSEIGDLCLEGAKREAPSIHEGVFGASEDLSSQLLKMKAAQVQALLNSGFEGDTLNLLKARRTLNYRVPIGGPDSDVLTAKVIAEQAPELENTVTFGYPEVLETFKARILKKDPANNLTVLEAAANAYLFLGQVAQALLACKQGDLECQLHNVTANGPNALLGFRGWQDRVAQHDFVLTLWKNGKKVVLK